MQEKTTRIVVFEYQNSGQAKIKGIKEYGHDIEIVQIVNIEGPLADFIDTPEEYITKEFQGDLVLCFLRHPDLTDYLAEICKEKGIPMIASGCKCNNALTPFTCCGLGKHEKLGQYGKQFGLPEFKVTTNNDIITDIKILRGASCGATWKAAASIIGLPVEEACSTLPREVQYLCYADPSAFDPISGKSSLHYAGHVHIAALKKALS